MTLLSFPLTLGAVIGMPIRQTPRFNTLVQTPASGRGIIYIPTMQFPLWDFNLDVTYLTGDATGVNTPWQELINFYMATQGAGNDWLFTHPYDNFVGSYTVAGTYTSGRFIARETVIQTSTGATATEISIASNQLTISPWNPAQSPDSSHTWVGQTSGAVFTPSGAPVLSTSQSIATGNGTTVGFSMIRSLVTGGAQDLIQNFTYSPFIYVNNSLQTNGYWSASNPGSVWNTSQYYTSGQYIIKGSNVYECILANINVAPPNATYWTSQSYTYIIDQYGTLTFTTAPTNTYNIAWTGAFQYRCHFEEDNWGSMQEDYYQLWTMEGLKFHSILL